MSDFKIAFIFAHRPTDVWSTPLSIVNEFKRREWETRIYSLFDVYDNYVDTNIQKLIDDKKSNEFNPDIVMYMDWGRFDSPLLDKKNVPGAFWVMESGDDPQNYDRNSVKADKFHLILTPAHDSYLKYKDKGHATLWWPHFADTNIHIPYNGYTPFDELPSVRSTRGPGGSNLMDYLSQIMPDKFINRNGLSGMEYGDFLNSGVIVFQQSRWHEITRRIFEGMACGKLIITDRLPIQSNIDNLFVENEDIVYYDNLGDCISKINYYLSSEAKEDRERISLNGYNKVIDRHTQVKRVDSILMSYKQY
jgi:spore maturation protein CgeB